MVLWYDHRPAPVHLSATKSYLANKLFFLGLRSSFLSLSILLFSHYPFISSYYHSFIHGMCVYYAVDVNYVFRPQKLPARKKDGRRERGEGVILLPHLFIPLSFSFVLLSFSSSFLSFLQFSRR